MSGFDFFRKRKKILPNERTGLLVGDARIRGRIDGLPGSDPAVLLFPQTDPADVWVGLVIPIPRDGKKIPPAKRLSFIARSKRIDPGRLAFIAGEKSGEFDWWTKLPPEWGNREESHPMVHGPAALVPLVVSILPDGFDGIAIYPVPAAEDQHLNGAALLVVAKKTGFVVWRDGSTLWNTEAIAMARRPLIDRTMEIVLQTGQNPPAESLLFIRDDRNGSLPLWEHLSDPVTNGETSLLDRALLMPPLVYDSPVVRSRRSVVKLKKFGPTLFLVILVGAGLWYYEKVLLVRDPRTIASLEARKENLETRLAAARRTRDGLSKIEADLAPRHWIRAIAILEYLSGGVSGRTMKITPSGGGAGFEWTISGRPLRGITPSDVQTGLLKMAEKLKIPVDRAAMKTGNDLSFDMTFTGSIPERVLRPTKEAP
ncbi:MAG: hypothetical protein ACYDBP_05810 [Leptospirales bacterium]